MIRDRQTDGRTDGQMLNAAIQRVAAEQSVSNYRRLAVMHTLAICL